MKERNCEHCGYVASCQLGTGVVDHEYRRYPPGHDGQWPKVGWYDWCGEWRPGELCEIEASDRAWQSWGHRV